MENIENGSQIGDSIINHDHSSEPSSFARMKLRQRDGHADKVAILTQIDSRGLLKNPSVKLFKRLYAFVSKSAPRGESFAGVSRVTFAVH